MRWCVYMGMHPEDLPSTVDELRELLLQTQRRAEVAERKANALTATVDDQRREIEHKDQTILDLLQALRGKQRERIDPDQLLLFEIGELEQLTDMSLLITLTLVSEMLTNCWLMSIVFCASRTS